MPCKDDVCRHESSGGGVTNYETEAENFFVELFQKMRQSYGESVRQMLMEHDGGDFDVEEEKRMLHDMMLSTEILKQKEFHAHDDRAFIHVALTLGDVWAPSVPVALPAVAAVDPIWHARAARAPHPLRLRPVSTAPPDVGGRDLVSSTRMHPRS